MGFEPAQLTLRYQIAVGELSDSAQDSLYIDLARDLSAVNRRLYRQGMTYFIQSMTVVAHSDDPDSAVFRIATAPNTWAVHNSWTKGFAVWKEQNDRVLKKNPSLKPMFHDYKVFLDQPMAADLLAVDAAANYVHADCDLLNPVDIDDNVIVPGEWLYSKMEFDGDDIDGSAYSSDAYVTILGENALGGTHKTVSLLAGYMGSRARLGSSNPPTGTFDGSWMIAADVGSEDELEEIATNLDVTNDAPPYFLTHPAGQGASGTAGNAWRSHGVGALAVGDANGSTDRMSGFAVPCGLVEIQYEDLGGNDSEDYFLYVTLMPGNYRGVAAVPMGQ